jgi:uncharacterized protein (DUF1810 family)
MPSDPFNLQRFLDAQTRVIENVRRELEGGRKRSHWMWFVFPQIDGLGFSAMARRYAIQSLEEAQAFAGHPVLGMWLRECTSLVRAVEGRTAYEIFGTPDDLKFHSCMTLFAQAAPDEQLFRRALEKFFDDAEDCATLEKLAQTS